MRNNQGEFNIKQIKGAGPAGLGLKKTRRFKFQIKYLKIAIGIIVIIVLVIAAIAFLKGWFSFSKDRVKLELVGPAEVSSGEEVEFSIRYQNNNRVALKDAKIFIDYPQGAYSLDGNELTREVIGLGKISPKKEGVKELKMRLAGEKGSIKSLAIRLNYQPANITSRFENSSILKMNISSVLIELYLTTPQKAINGEEVFYILDYLNTSDEDFSNLKIELSYPSGFSFKKAEPEPNEQDNIWQLKELKKGERGTIRVTGILEGVERENKALGASIGRTENNNFLKYSQTSSVTQISSSPLLLSLSLNDREKESNVSLGQRLNYKIRFRNNADIALSQLILKVYLEGEMFDFKNLSLGNKGFFDSLNNIITWSAAGVPSLALLPPGESGEIGFVLPVKDSFSINNFDDKNFQISIQAELETLNVPSQFNIDRLKISKVLNSKVNTKVILQAKGYYNETTTGIRNSGPMPPRVNQITTYTIHWQITNTSNDLEDVRVTAILPQGIEWQDNYTALSKGAELVYNERTKQIVWTIDKIPAATGFLIPVYELVFQVALRPSITQIGERPVLIDESRLRGKDIFTGEIRESFDSAIDTNLPDDLSVTDGRVRE